MPHRRLRVDSTEVVRAGLAAIRAEHAVPAAFTPAAEAEAARAASAPAPGPPARAASAPAPGPPAPAASASPPGPPARADLRDVAFFTIDPPGSRDLDQALALERDGAGFRIRYAIADVAHFVAPDGALDREAHERGVTVYLPDEKAPLHPPVLSEGAASLLAGSERPALVWDLRLAADGTLDHAELVPAIVRSREQLDYATAQERSGEGQLRLLREVGERRLAIADERGATRLALPEQEVVRGEHGWTIAYRAQRPVEQWNAEISLLSGMAAAQIMRERGAGILRTQPAPDPAALAGVRRAAAALGAPWPDEEPYHRWLAGLDPARPEQAALLHEAAAAGEGASYVAFDGAPPEDAGHFAIAAPYAHVTAPLRRLADRYALACCGPHPPGWARERLAQLPEEMERAARRAGAVERAVVDLVEAVLLRDRVGETFTAVVLDANADGAKVLLREPAVRARAEGAGMEPGQEVALRLAAADPATRSVRFQRA